MCDDGPLVATFPPELNGSPNRFRVKSLHTSARAARCAVRTRRAFAELVARDRDRAECGKTRVTWMEEVDAHTHTAYDLMVSSSVLPQSIASLR